MDARDKIVEALTRALVALGIEAEPVLDFPADLAHGDYSTNVAMVGAKVAQKSPKTLAEEIVVALGTIEGVSKIEVAGPGFINFTLVRESYASVLQKTSIEGDRWGSNESLKGKRVMYEFTDPNPFKVFHIGHLMSNAIGESLARLSEYQGATVIRANYQGDIGPHVARCLWGVMKEGLDVGSIEQLGRAYVIGSTAYEDDPKAKEEIDAINKKLYQRSDPELNRLYDVGRRTSLDHFEEIYTILGTKFAHYFFESEVGPIGVEVVKQGLKDGVFEESEGAVIYRGEKIGLHTRVFITKAGTPTYEAKELGLDKTKFEKEKLDHSIIVTAVEQKGFFEVVLAAMAEVLPEVAKRTKHVWHGMMQLTDGKMSSRKGNVVTGESLIEDMRAEALAKMDGRDLTDKQSVADAVAIAAIKFSILKQGSGKNIIFDPAQSLSFEGDSGPYLQYSYVRAMSVLTKARLSGSGSAMIYHSTSLPDIVPTVERLLPRFPDMVLRAAQEYEPHHVTTYLTELAGAFSSWYAGEKIIGSEGEAYKLALVRAFAQTMKNGLWLLGISAPEKM